MRNVVCWLDHQIEWFSTAGHKADVVFAIAWAIFSSRSNCHRGAGSGQKFTMWEVDWIRIILYIYGQKQADEDFIYGEFIRSKFVGGVSWK